MRARVIWSGATLVAVGLSLLLLVAEWFSAFDACLANTACIAPGSLSTLEGSLALMAVGVAITVGGATVALIGLRADRGGRIALTP
jgi:hypothetical protein